MLSLNFLQLWPFSFLFHHTYNVLLAFENSLGFLGWSLSWQAADGYTAHLFPEYPTLIISPYSFLSLPTLPIIPWLFLIFLIMPWWLYMSKFHCILRYQRIFTCLFFPIELHCILVPNSIYTYYKNTYQKMSPSGKQYTGLSLVPSIQTFIPFHYLSFFSII